MNLFLKINKQYEKNKTLSNEIKHIEQNNNIIIKYPWNFNNQDFTEIRKTIVTYSKKNIYSNNEIVNHTNFININSRLVLSIMVYIQVDKILIVSSNINFADACLGVLQNIKIVLFVYNNKEIGSFFKLKEKYKDSIDIYYIGSYLNYNTYNTIKNILSKTDITLFNTIIIDNGILDDFNHQENGVITSILLSKYFLETNGCFILFANLVSI